MQALLNPDGNGRLFVNSSGSGWKWEACIGHPVTCTRVPGSRELIVPANMRGSVFVVHSQGQTGRSPEWTGKPRVTAPPRVQGEVRGGGYAVPTPGRWTGGWRGEYSEFQLAACAGPGGVDCVALTSPHYVRPCSADASIALPSWSAGMYLRVAEQRVGAQPAAMLAFGVTSPAAEKVWPRGPVIAVAEAGQIAPSSGPAAECGPAIEPRAWISKKGVASVECVGGCHAELLAGQGSDVQRVEDTLVPTSALVAGPPRELRIPEASLRRLGSGHLRFTVVIDGQQVTAQTVDIPAAHR